jgi:hypothetical protein
MGNPIREEKNPSFVFKEDTIIDEPIIVLPRIVEPTSGTVRSEETYTVDAVFLFPCRLLTFMVDAII